MKNFLITLGTFILGLCLFFSIVHNDITDRINRLIHEKISYAEVPLKSQNYRNVQVYDEKGNKLRYRIKKIDGYDQDKKYILIDHQGQYIRSINYISKKEFMKHQK